MGRLPVSGPNPRVPFGGLGVITCRPTATGAVDRDRRARTFVNLCVYGSYNTTVFLLT
jgi:hypothetical protein